MSIYLWSYFKENYSLREQELLIRLADEIEKTVKLRLKSYEVAHFQGAALYNAFGDFNSKEWAAWVKSNRLREIYPGIRGIGVAVPVKNSDSLKFVNAIRKEIPLFSVKALASNLRRDYRYIIKYIEPIDINIRALGVDMGSEMHRREQMDKARLTGKTFITDKVVLAQDEKRRPGFLMYVPTYHVDNAASDKERIDNFRCWIYSAFVVSEFFEGMIGDDMKNIVHFISFDLYSGIKQDTSALIYSFHAKESLNNSTSLDRTIDLYGQKWTFHISGNKSLSEIFTTRQPAIILFSGFLLSIVLSVLIYNLMNKKQEAIGLAKSMTRELLDLNHFYENLIQAMNEGLLVVDHDLLIIKANRHFYKLFKKSETVEQKNLKDLTNPVWAEVVEVFRKAVEANAIIEKEYNFSFDDGERKCVKITYIPLDKFLESVPRVLLVIDDITDKKENEQRRNDFIGFVSHELRTPISNLKAYAQLSERFISEGNCEETFKLNKKIQSFIDVLNDLVSELHDVTKMTSGKFQVHKSEFNFDELIDEAIENATLTYPDFKFSRKGEQVGSVCADRLRISQVLNNYISNAVKYSHGKFDVYVITEKVNDQVIASVKDFGIGIPEKDLAHIFERLYRVPKSSRREGLGMGLYLSKEIIRSHGGEVWLKSEENHGSEFFFSLPIKDPGSGS